MSNKVLIIGSGFSAKEVNNYPYANNGWTIVTVNHGWLSTPDWNYNVIPDDYKGQSPKPDLNLNQKIIFSPEYSPILNKFGGNLECGLSITLTASYWSLNKFKPIVIGYLGANMIYTPNTDGHTAIYGVGLDIKANNIPDPDRMAEYSKLLNLNSGGMDYITYIYKRFEQKAEELNCKVYNLSSYKVSRLPYKKINVIDLDNSINDSKDI